MAEIITTVEITANELMMADGPLVKIVEKKLKEFQRGFQKVVSATAIFPSICNSGLVFQVHIVVDDSGDPRFAPPRDH